MPTMRVLDQQELKNSRMEAGNELYAAFVKARLCAAKEW
jgi:hypothetical protein